MSGYFRSLYHSLQTIANSKSVAKKAALMALLGMISLTAYATEILPSKITPLTQTTWNQGAPYNQYTPLLRGQHTYTGCASVAVSQLLKYYNYPAQGEGETSYYWEAGDQSLSIDFGATAFNWSMMPNSLDGATASQKDAVSKLIYQVGVGIQADYGLDQGSSAGGKLIENLLRYNLKYVRSRRSMYTEMKSNGDGWEYYSNEEWLEMIKREVSQFRPVLYLVRNPAGAGHVFLIDGYNEQGQVHVNWGWGGFGDGYYDIDKMNPDPNEPDEKWIINPMMFIGLQPITGNPYTTHPLPVEEPSSNQEEKVSQEQGRILESQWKHYGPFVNISGDFTATLSGTEDADLYVREGAQATLGDYDCRPYEEGTNESCTQNGAGSYYVSINGYAAASDYNLEIQYLGTVSQ